MRSALYPCKQAIQPLVTGPHQDGQKVYKLSLGDHKPKLPAEQPYTDSTENEISEVQSDA